MPYSGLYTFYGGPSSGVRALLPLEMWRSWGLVDRTWKDGVGDGGLGLSFLSAMLRSLPEGHARCFVASALHWSSTVKEETRRSGMCVFPEEVTVAARLSKWLETWRKNPDQPVEFSQYFRRRKGWVKTGGGSRQAKEIARGSTGRSGLTQTPVLWLGPPDPFTLRCCECERALGTSLLQPCVGSGAGEP